jgi:hypothetical protein
MVDCPLEAPGMAEFVGDWHGWRLQGRFLVSPEGEHITQERLSGLLWRDGMELRLAGFASRRKAEKALQRSASKDLLRNARGEVLQHFRPGGG